MKTRTMKTTIDKYHKQQGLSMTDIAKALYSTYIHRITEEAIPDALTSDLQNIDEALTPEQKADVDTWKRGDNSFSDHAYEDSADPDRVSIPLRHPGVDSPHQEAIQKHLEKHGFKIKDYVAGKAEDKYGRETNIGRALNGTKAEPGLIKNFNEDPARARSKSSTSSMKVVISRHPHDVAGMTSGGQSWENQSCMNFSNGAMRRYLPRDVSGGTHVAYLVDKDDDNVERPYARIALKKFKELRSKGEEILRPENRTYGEAPDSFTHTVNKWVNEKFPGNEKSIYKKDPKVYDDTGNNYVIGKGALDKAVKSKVDDIRLAAASHPDLSDEHIASLSVDPVSAINRRAIDHPKFTPKHLENVALNGPANAKEHAYYLRNKEFTPQLLKKMAAGDDDSAKIALMHSDAPPEVISQAFKHSSSIVRAAAAAHKGATAEDLHAAMDDTNSHVRARAVANLNAAPQTITKALHDPVPRVRQEAVYPGWNEAAIQKWHNLSTDQLKTAASDDDVTVRSNVANHPNLPVGEHAKLLNDPHPYVKVAAIQNPQTNISQLTRAIRDPDPDVVNAALGHPKATPFMLEQSADHRDPQVVWSVANHPNTPRESLKKILNGPHNSAALRAVQHPNLTKQDLMDVYEHHPSRTVRRGAEKMLNNQ